MIARTTAFLFAVCAFLAVNAHKAEHRCGHEIITSEEPVQKSLLAQVYEPYVHPSKDRQNINEDYSSSYQSIRILFNTDFLTNDVLLRQCTSTGQVCCSVSYCHTFYSNIVEERLQQRVQLAAPA
jgi:hypothetical protein